MDCVSHRQNGRHRRKHVSDVHSLTQRITTVCVYSAAVYESESSVCINVCRLVREAREKIAELEYSQTHLRELNAEMRGWLDVADDDMAALRSENAALRSRVEE